MDVVLFGATSMIGWSILQAAPVPVLAFCNTGTRQLPPQVATGIDLDDEQSVATLFERIQPRLVINCAGVCDVATCETSPEFARAVNVEGTRNLLTHAPASTRVVHLSSDHVFSGDTGPYDEQSPTDPISVYGKTRVAAESLVAARAGTLSIRPGLWIGPSYNTRIGHLDWLRDRHRRQLPMTIVADEHRSAVWADEAAARAWALARSQITGVRHIVATRTVSRPDLARHLDRTFTIGAALAFENRRERKTPHLGRVELRTSHDDAFAAPLRSVVD